MHESLPSLRGHVPKNTATGKTMAGPRVYGKLGLRATASTVNTHQTVTEFTYCSFSRRNKYQAQHTSIGGTTKMGVVMVIWKLQNWLQVELQP
jgi:hypothetical protein